MRRHWILALSLATASLAPACGQPPEDEAGESSDAITERLAKIRFTRLKESISPVYRAVVKDPTEVGDTMRKTLNDTEITFSADVRQGRQRDLIFKVVRNAVVSLGKTKVTRKLMVQSSAEALTRRSNKLKRLFLTTAEQEFALPGKENVFDELVVGMGPQSVAYMQATTDLAPTKRILAVDLGKKPGGTFANVNEAFALNSTNRANTGTRAQPGQGDLNFIQDIWGLPDFAPQKWTPAGGLGDLATVGTDLSSANALLETRIVSVKDVTREQARAQRYLPNWPARYEVELLDEATGQKMKVYTDRLIVGSGIGKPTIPIQEPKSLEFIAAETKRVEDILAANPKLDPLDKSVVPRVMTFTDLVNKIGQSETPYRWAVDKDIVVVGGGDSGKVINEFLLRDAPEAAYALDSAQVGNVKRIFWVGVDFKTCQEFIAASRGRYSRLQSALNSGQLVPVPGKVTQLMDQGGGKVRLFTTSPVFDQAAGSPQGPRELLFFETKNVPGAAGYGNASYVNADVDNVILATGFKSEAEKVFQQVIGEQPDAAALKPLLDDVVAQPEGFEAPVAIASRLKNNVEGVLPQEVYFIGPSNEVRGGLPKPDELARVNANTVSLFANVSRTRKLAAMNAETAAKGLQPLEEALGIGKIGDLMRKREPVETQGSLIARAVADAPKAKLSTIADVELKAQMSALMQRFGMPEQVPITIRVTQAADNQLRIAAAELDPASEQLLAQSMVTEVPRVSEMLFSYFAKPSNVKSIEIVLPPFTGRGDVRASGIDIIRRAN